MKVNLSRIDRGKPHKLWFVHSSAEVILVYLRIVPLACESKWIIDSFRKLRVRVLAEGGIGVGVYNIGRSVKDLPYTA